ncbi:hypothetical protein C8R46DRAFT_1210098 [Mycena filopes]|nr:hypothetical protein C8R46DRAFT_1210098 [Mycena filopes]
MAVYTDEEKEGGRRALLSAYRHPPPRALSALSHTLRALAASTQAVTSYAYNSPSSHSSTQSHHVNAARHHEDGGEEDGEEEIKGARWDEVGVGGAGSSTTRRLLTLTYAAGVQVWDASALGGVSEVLNLRIPTPASFSSSNTTTSDTSNTTTTTTTSRARSSVDTLRAVHHHNSDNDKKEEKEGDGDDEEMYGPILGASILPAARGSKEESGGLELGILTPHALYIYALAAGHVVARCAFPPAASKDKGTGKDAARQEYAYGGGGGRVREREPEIGTPCAFEAAERVIVVTTHSPPALVVLSRPGLRVLHVIPASALAVPHAPISPVGTNSSGSRRSSYAGSPPFSSSSTSASPPTTFTSPPTHAPSPSPPPPTPTSALHGRLLAFLAPAPPAAPPLGAPANTSADAEGGVTATWGRSIGRFFSRSAPAATAIAASVFAAAGSPPLPGVGMVGGIGGGEKGTAWVRVVDLGALGNGGKGGGLREVHVFEAGRAAVGGLAFARDGTRLCVVRRDGLGAGVWALRPSPYPQLPGDPPKQVYALRRGRTGAVVEGVAGARDGRFVALATRRRTVHVFAVNPYGGRADHRSHLGGRVRDAEGAGAEVQQGDGPGEPTEVHALVRMRLPAAKTHQHHQHGEEELPPPPPPAPLAIAFVPASSTSVGTGTGLRSPVSSPSSPSSSAIQDVLVFDPADGVLSLRRVTLALEAPHAAGLPISVSLPAARIAGLSMSASPPGYAYPGAPAAGSYARTVYGQGTGQQQAEVPGMELGGREAVVATWSLRRRRGWAEIRRTEAGAGAGEVVLASGRPVKEDWIAQAELSTFSSAPRVLPRAIYLSHQFSFHALGEDYHALIRRYQLAIGGAKIEVRREVEVSAFSAAGTGGEAFVEGHNASSSPRDIRRRSRAASSFDEPLASALAGVAHYRDVRPPPVLPMLPNGSPSSFRSAMPVPVRAVVAGLGDGVAEGLARVRREMRHQRQRQLARSPPAKGGDDVEASVPLEFDEEDEDFTGPPASSADEVFLRVHADREDDDALSATSRNGGDSVASISTPATSAHPLEDEERMEVDLNADLDAGEGEGEWHGWAAEDKLAVEEAERFDDISVVGFLDEEQAAMQAEAARRKSVAAGAGTAGGRGRKKRRN